MALNISNAINAYASAARPTTTGLDAVANATTNAAAGPAQDFAGLVKNAAQSSIDTMKTGERMSMMAIAGQADLTEVVTAVSAAEVTLQTVMAVRDKVITAYNEIMRMPI
ncbi:MAG: flagellar hook-basal body complex protein FliE [Alphaproteobacteria bacterium]|nr:flagellar hook-basal body complex protein FliE [Alphaproteobacteria bacterium]